MEQDIYMDSIYTSTAEKVWQRLIKTMHAWLLWLKSNGEERS